MKTSKKELRKLMKNYVPEEMRNFIIENYGGYAKATSKELRITLLLKGYEVESYFKESPNMYQFAIFRLDFISHIEKFIYDFKDKLIEKNLTLGEVSDIIRKIHNKYISLYLCIRNFNMEFDPKVDNGLFGYWDLKVQIAGPTTIKENGKENVIKTKWDEEKFMNIYRKINNFIEYIEDIAKQYNIKF